jgi:hypothetical protein
MAEKVLLEKLHDEYCEKLNAGFSQFPDTAQLDNQIVGLVVSGFCSFADTWLKDKGIIGLGHTTDGLALRFKDGSEYLLLKNDSDIYTGLAVGVTGGNEKINAKAELAAAPSFQITGRE